MNPKNVLAWLSAIAKEFEAGEQKNQLSRCSELIDILLKSNDNSRERANLVRSLIRVSSESADHRVTVNMISKKVLEQLSSESQNRKKNLDGKDFRHEHMFPCRAAQREIEKSKGAIKAVLAERIAFRALITSGEATRLDKNYKHCLPEQSMKSDCPAPALSRYCAERLVSELKSVNQRGERMLEARNVSNCGGCPHFDSFRGDRGN